MTSKHTPGPWRVFICDDGKKWSGWPLSILSENEEDKSVVRPGGFYPYEWDAAMSQREAIANARLIAAAPDMYEALKAAIASGMVPLSSVSDGGAVKYSAQVQAADLIRAAIAKAEGK